MWFLKYFVKKCDSPREVTGIIFVFLSVFNTTENFVAVSCPYGKNMYTLKDF